MIRERIIEYNFVTRILPFIPRQNTPFLMNVTFALSTNTLSRLVPKLTKMVAALPFSHMRTSMTKGVPRGYTFKTYFGRGIAGKSSRDLESFIKIALAWITDWKT